MLLLCVNNFRSDLGNGILFFPNLGWMKNMGQPLKIKINNERIKVNGDRITKPIKLAKISNMRFISLIQCRF